MSGGRRKASPPPRILGWPVDRRRLRGRRWMGRRGGRLRRVRGRRRIQRRRRGREILMREAADRVVTPFLAQVDAALGAGTARCCTGRRPAATSCRGGRTSTSCSSSTTSPRATLGALGRAVRPLAEVGVRAAAGDRPPGVGPRHRRLSHRDHRHALRLRGAPRPGSARRAHRRAGGPAPCARARVPRQAAAPPPGIRRRGGRPRRPSAPSPAGAPAP